MPSAHAAVVYGPPLLCALLLVHSLTARGARVTAVWWSLAALFLLLKGLVDVPRAVEEMPYRMNLSLWERGGRNFGVYLFVWPCIRLAAAYLSFVAAEVVSRASEARRDRFWPLAGVSLLCFAVAGQLVEHANLAAGWWTWHPWTGRDGHGAGPLLFFFVWIELGVGLFLGVLAAFLPRAGGAPRWRRGALVVLAYYVFLVGISVVAPFLRNLLLIPASLVAVGLGLTSRGPRLEVRRPVAAAASPEAGRAADG